MSLGEVLQAQRKSLKNKNSLEKATQDLKIDIKYLQALEEGEYDRLPKGIYGKNFLREYCYYLRLNYKQMLQLYEKEESLYYSKEKDKVIFSHQKPKSRYFLSLPKLIRSIILVVVIFACFIYLGFRVRKVIAPPALDIGFPPESYITKDVKIKVQGKSEPEVDIIINGQEVVSDEQGQFFQEINLKKGMNIINIEANKKYGRDTEVVRQVLVK